MLKQSRVTNVYGKDSLTGTRGEHCKKLSRCCKTDILFEGGLETVFHIIKILTYFSVFLCKVFFLFWAILTNYKRLDPISHFFCQLIFNQFLLADMYNQITNSYTMAVTMQFPNCIKQCMPFTEKLIVGWPSISWLLIVQVPSVSYETFYFLSVSIHLKTGYPSIIFILEFAEYRKK